jgi:hypothetical protein
MPPTDRMNRPAGTPGHEARTSWDGKPHVVPLQLKTGSLGGKTRQEEADEPITAADAQPAALTQRRDGRPPSGLSQMLPVGGWIIVGGIRIAPTRAPGDCVRPDPIAARPHRRSRPYSA